MLTILLCLAIVALVVFLIGPILNIIVVAVMLLGAAACFVIIGVCNFIDGIKSLFDRD